MMTPAEQAEKGPAINVLRQMVDFVAQRSVEVEIQGH
jgi:hypothetical protein